MPSLLMIDPVYNPGDIPPSVSLGKVEAAFLRSGVTLSLQDFVVPEALITTLEQFYSYEAEFIRTSAEQSASVDVVYISAEHGNELKPYPMYPRIMSLARAIKQRTPWTKVVVGGALANLFLGQYKFEEDELRRDVVDLIITGQTYAAIKPLSDMLGVAYPSLVAHSAWKLWDFTKYPSYASIQMRSGCAYKCDFCFEGHLYNKRNISESVEAIQAAILELKGRSGIRSFMLEDSVVMSYTDFGSIVDAMGATGATFAVYARVSEICRWPERLRALKDAGCTCVVVGIESLDDDILRSTNKRTLAVQTKTALATARQMGMEVQGCFMLGFPNGGLEDARNTMRFAIEADLCCYRWHVYMPNYTRMDPSFYALRPCHSIDILDVQLNVPDKFLLEHLATQPMLGFLDEHTLVRLLPHIGSDHPALTGTGYRDRFDYGSLVRLMQAEIDVLRLPLNEDQMYDRLFFSRKSLSRETATETVR